MKIKTKVNVVKEIEVDIKLPYFCKTENGRVFFKLLNEDGDCLKVVTYSFEASVEFSEISHNAMIFEEGNTEIEENEFNEAFEQVLEILKNK